MIDKTADGEPLRFERELGSKLVTTLLMGVVATAFGIPFSGISLLCVSALRSYEWGGEDLPLVGVPIVIGVAILTGVIGFGLLGFVVVFTIGVWLGQVEVEEDALLIRKRFRVKRIPLDEIKALKYSTTAGGDGEDFESRIIDIEHAHGVIRIHPAQFGMSFEEVKRFDAYISKRRGVARHNPASPVTSAEPAAEGTFTAWVQDRVSEAEEVDRYFGTQEELGLARSAITLSPGSCGWCGALIEANQWLDSNGDSEGHCPNCAGILPPFCHQRPTPPPEPRRNIPAQCSRFTKRKFRTGVLIGAGIAMATVGLGVLAVVTDPANSSGAVALAIIGGFLGVGIALLARFGASDRINTLEKGIAALGVVERVTHQTRSSSYSITIKFPVQGNYQVLYTSSKCSSMRNYRVGQPIWVVHPLRRPYNAAPWPPLP